MIPSRLYLDHNASAPLLPEARQAMLEVLQMDGNASSIHSEGRRIRKAIEHARGQLGSVIGVNGNQIVFTSGASEAAAHALSPIIRAGGRQVLVSKLYVNATEHTCVLAGGRFNASQIEILPVKESGLLDLDKLKSALQNHDASDGAPMVAVMLANNETGIVQPIREIAALVGDYEGFLVVDAVQAFGRLPLDISKLGAHFVILSSHKIGGPKGAGALIFGDASISPEILIRGGGQENFQRGGTENSVAIAGFGAACDAISTKLAQSSEIAAIRDSIESGIDTICKQAGNKVGEAVFFGQSAERLANTSCFAVPGVKAETALISLDLAGIAVSSGSACSSGKVRKSHVLDAMAVEDDLARCALRVSTGAMTGKEDANRFLDAFKQIVSRVA